MSVTIKPGVKPLIKTAKPSVPASAGVQLIAKDESAPPPQPKLKAPAKAAEAPLKVKAYQPTATITKDHSDGTSVNEKENVGDPILSHVPMANVGVQMGVTRNLDNFENFKFSVSLHLPCPADEQGIDDAYGVAKAWVDKKIELINEEVNEQLGVKE